LRWRSSPCCWRSRRRQLSRRPACAKANHQPVAVVNGIGDTSLVVIPVINRQRVTLDASTSSDPDGDRLADQQPTHHSEDELTTQCVVFLYFLIRRGVFTV